MRALLLLLLASFCGSRSLLHLVDAQDADADNDSDNDNDNGAPKIGDVLDDGTVLGAKGGTELMAGMLFERLPSFFWDRFTIFRSRVREVPTDNKKKNILWIADLPNDPEQQHLQYPASRNRFATIVFVSEWQRQQFVQYFSFPFTNSVVIKNAIVPLPVQPKDENGPLRLIYHTTPHRGLEILMPVFERLYETYGNRISLDVYSSFSMYGWSHRDEPYKQYFDMCRQHPACHYHGAVSNQEVREALLEAHIFAYPSIWMETSCIAAMEALSAGCEIVTSDLGALPETLREFGTMYKYNPDKNEHAKLFETHLREAIDSFWLPEKVTKRRRQQIAAAQSYDIGFFGLGGRIEEWIQLLASFEADLSGTVTPARSAFDSDAQYAEALITAGRIAELKGNTEQAVEFYKPVYNVDKTNSHWLIAFGSLLLMLGTNIDITSPKAAKGAEMLEFAMTNSTVHPQISKDSPVIIGMGARLAFYYAQQYKDGPSFYWLDQMTASRYPHDDCWQIFQATQVPHLPGSPEEEKQRIVTYHKNIDALLSQNNLICQDANAIGSVFPVAYYDLNFSDELGKFALLLTKAFPWLDYAAPGLEYGQEASVDIKAAQGNDIRIGVLSSFMEPHSSIWGSFGMTIRFLQTHPWLNVSLIYYPREPIRPEFQYLSMNPSTNIYLDRILKVDPGALDRNRKKITDAKFDVLLYLDLFMTMEMHQLAVSKLAPIQACTHGHPVTSGVRREVMDYYLSWEAAELPDKTMAQTFYTEELVLIPSNTTWEFYEPRSTPREQSIMGNKGFGHYTRKNLDFITNESDHKRLLVPNAVWYFCSQASFKFHIEFDKALGKIQERDPNAVIILIRQTGQLDELYQKTKRRFVNLGYVDTDRIVFVPRLQHYQLMAMYKLSDVILDSFYFGGDTTTREAFEVGAPVVTLPHKTIGQRWTQAYYKRMGITDFIAKDPDDYARLAVEVANRNDSEKKKVKKRIIESARANLFRNHEGYPEWAKALIDIARRPRHWHWNDAARASPHTVEMKKLPDRIGARQEL